MPAQALSAPIREIVSRLGGSSAVAEILSVPQRRVRAWWENGHIPSWYWSGLLDAAAGLGVPLSQDELQRISDLRRRAA